jgi:hypothetical protein
MKQAHTILAIATPGRCLVEITAFCRRTSASLLLGE